MMDCKAFAMLLDVSPEERSQEQKRQMEAHMQECVECAALYTLMRDCRVFDDRTEVPSEFTLGWRTAIREEETMEKKQTRNHWNWQRFLATAAAVVLVFGGATLSYLNEWGMPAAGGGDNGGNYAYRTVGGMQANYMLATNSTYDAEPQSEGVMMAKSASTTADQQEAKIIRTINYSIKTRQYDEDFEALKMLTAENGGYVESLSISGDVSSGETRYANFTLRIPAENLDAFLGNAKTVGTATSYSEYTEDVSESYYDIVTRLETQKAKLARLNELLIKAENMSDLIEIESAISDTQYQIDRYMGQLNGYDSRIKYSYVYVTLRELRPNDVAESNDVTLWERVVNAVQVSLEELGYFAESVAVFAIAALPWCGVLLAAVIVVKIIRRVTRRKQK